MANTPSADGSSTPSTFAAQNTTAEELLKTQTVGLVTLNEYRKRHAEAREQKEREADARIQSGFASSRSGTATPVDGVTTAQQPPKKKRKTFAKGKLSFGLDEEDGENSTISTPKPQTPRSSTPAIAARDGTTATEDEERLLTLKRKLGPNAKLSGPKVMTKAALAKEAETREQLRKEYLLMQEAVKVTDICMPFVFYDGSNIPGGTCRVKKGDHIWLFLDRARKVGAETGAGGGDKSRREWARVGVDDLMLVRGEIIVPHHYDFHYFILNKTQGFNGPIFPYASEILSGKDKDDAANGEAEAEPQPLQKSSLPDEELEGYNDDPALTKVVDRRWYEKNKHIFPASVWEEFDPNKDYTTGIRKDAEGNKFFYR